jgi:mannose/cellobiose epimerase-like protein (N-acyl-D-glucosamine 2-epimerase family)
MSKTLVSAFDSQKTARRLLASAVASGFDSRFFSVINSIETEETPLDSLKRVMPSIEARIYRKHLQKGESLLVAQVPENEVARLIKLLQSTGGRHIEAFDEVSAA